MKNIFGKFYQKSITERKSILREIDAFDDRLNIIAADEVFDHMIENVITTFELPMGLVPDYMINGKQYLVPLVTEEASVVAASSHAAKIVLRNGGFSARVINREMIGQIIFKVEKEQDIFIIHVLNDMPHLMELARLAHPQIVTLGGGLNRIEVLKKSNKFICLYAYIHTVDAMGANTVNTILESIATYIEQTYHPHIVMSILSNLATESLVEARCIIDPNTLKHPDKIATYIADASEYALLDPYRAATHNKGIMNGISALVLATGNDTRAIEAGAHAYASISGNYEPLATWKVLSNGHLEGTILLPMAIGTVGGATHILPKAKLAHKLLGNPTATTLMEIAACVGLASNFAALYALTTDGIQKGHMRLHAKTLAVQAGATPEQIHDVVEHLVQTQNFTLDNALNFLKNKN